jgi:hypothetical protein
MIKIIIFTIINSKCFAGFANHNNFAENKLIMDVIDGVRVFHRIGDLFNYRDEHILSDAVIQGSGIYVDGVLIAKYVKK